LFVTWTGWQTAAVAICGLSCLLRALFRFIVFAHCINPANPVCIFPGILSNHLNAAVHPAAPLCFIARPLRRQNAEFFKVKAGAKLNNHLALAWLQPCSALGLAKG